MLKETARKPAPKFGYDFIKPQTLDWVRSSKDLALIPHLIIMKQVTGTTTFPKIARVMLWQTL